MRIPNWKWLRAIGLVQDPPPASTEGLKTQVGGPQQAAPVAAGHDSFHLAPRHRDLFLYLSELHLAGSGIRASLGPTRIPRTGDVEAIELLLPQGVLLRGIPGVGKSTILREIATRASQRGRDVVQLSVQEGIGAGGVQQRLDAALAENRPFTLLVDEVRMLGDPSAPATSTLIKSLRKAVAEEKCEVLLVLHEGPERDALARAIGFSSYRPRPISRDQVKTYLGVLTSRFGVPFTSEAQETIADVALTPQQLEELIRLTLLDPVQSRFEVAAGKPKQWAEVWTRRKNALPVQQKHVLGGLRALELAPETLQTFDPRTMLRLLMEPSVRPANTVESNALAVMESNGVVGRNGDAYTLRDSVFAWSLRNGLDRRDPAWRQLAQLHRQGDPDALRRVAAILGSEMLGAGFKAVSQERP